MGGDLGQSPGGRTAPPRSPAGGAFRVASGILASRLVGFVRDAAFTFFFGVGPHADVLATALRGPNVLQNLLGEQTLSASFIPVYTRFLGAGREEDAGRFAGAVLGLLVAAVAGLSILGVVFARPIVAVLAPGYLDDPGGPGAVDRYHLTVRAVRIIFPMSGLLVLSAWALGVLNSHRRFFLAYFAPVFWNVAILAGLFGGARLVAGEGPGAPAAFGVPALDRLLLAACWGALAGGALQFAVQLPLAARLLRGFRLAFSRRVPGVPEALRAFGPLLAGRGVLQLSGYLDFFLASFLAVGAVGSLRWAQALYLLPIALFGMSVAAAELPELSRASSGEPSARVERSRRALAQIGFLAVPSAIGYLAFGFLLVGAVFRRGSFGVGDNWLVYLVLCGYAIGIVASTASRLLGNVFYSLGETRIPARIAVWRVAGSALLGGALMLWLDRHLVAEVVGMPPAERTLRLGAVGLALASGLAAWLELGLLTRALRGAAPGFHHPWEALRRFTLLALVAALGGVVVWWFLPALPVLPAAALVVGCFAVLYLGAAWLLRWPEARLWGGRAAR